MVLAFALAGCSAAPRRAGDEGSARDLAKDCRTPEMAELAYSTGCYEAYKRICLEFAREEKIGLCREDGLAICEKSGKNFRAFIEGEKKPR